MNDHKSTHVNYKKPTSSNWDFSIFKTNFCSFIYSSVSSDGDFMNEEMNVDVSQSF